MGFLSDVGHGLVKYTSPVGYAYEQGRGANATEAPNIDRSRTDRPYVSSNQGAKTLADSIFNDTNSQDYGNTFDTAYQNLNQPLHDANRAPLYTAGTRALAESFTDQVYKQTGSLPTEDQIRQFVGSTLTPAFAQKFITGIAPDQITSMASDYIKGNPDALTNPGTVSAAQAAQNQYETGLTGQLDKAFEAGKQNLVSGYDTNVYGPQKTQAVNDLAGQGMLQNPNSRYTLNALDANRSRDLTSGITSLAGAQAQGQVGLDTTIQDILQKNADRAQNAYQFGKTYNAAQDNTAFNQGLQTRALGMADTIGKLQANNNKKDPLDYFNAAVNAGGTAAKAYTAFK